MKKLAREQRRDVAAIAVKKDADIDLRDIYRGQTPAVKDLMVVKPSRS